MMKQYKYFFKMVLAVALAACSSDEAPQLLPTEKEPLIVTASVDGSLPTATTRASGNSFAAGDVIVAYLQHVDGSNGVVTGFSKSFKFNPTQNSDATWNYKLTTPDGADVPYWDDFSNAANDIRTGGHGVRSYYAYCMNGGTATVDESAGTLTWTVLQDQSVDDNLQKSDLLWSGTQGKVTYQHAKESRKGLQLPFTHAMSKVTIVVTANEGFEAGNLKNTQVILKGMNTSATVNLPVKQLSNQANSYDITMCCTTSEVDALQRSYEAIIVPGTEFTSGNTLAVISDADGNNYNISVTAAMLENGAWGAQYDNDGAKSGVNYKLEVTINKQKIEAVASLADWTDVESTGAKGEIQFTSDITTSEGTNTVTAGSFDLYWGTAVASLSQSTGWSYSDGKWTNATPIYWANGTEAYYFRALAKFETNTEIKAASMSSPYTVNQGGEDILWATTPAHTWGSTSVAEGKPVHPRTGAVPLSFRHALSKVTVKLLTSSDANEQVVLTNATVTISPIATTGTLKLENGTIELPTGEVNGQLSSTVNDEKSITSLTIPQKIGDNVKLQVKLSDNTTYSLQLNTCKNTSSEPIIAWAQGTHYTYEVTLNKEKISFVAYVKDWEPETGTGDATLDW